MFSASSAGLASESTPARPLRAGARATAPARPLATLLLALLGCLAGLRGAEAQPMKIGDKILHPEALAQLLVGWDEERSTIAALHLEGVFLADRYSEGIVDKDGLQFVDLGAGQGWIGYRHIGQTEAGVQVLLVEENQGGTLTVRSILLVRFVRDKALRRVADEKLPMGRIDAGGRTIMVSAGEIVLAPGERVTVEDGKVIVSLKEEGGEEKRLEIEVEKLLVGSGQKPMEPRKDSDGKSGGKGKEGAKGEGKGAGKEGKADEKAEAKADEKQGGDAAPAPDAAAPASAEK